MLNPENQPPNGQTPTEDPKGANPSTLKSLGLLAVILGDLIGYTGLFLGVTGYLVKNQGWPSWTVFLGLILGFFVAFFQIYRKAKRLLN